MNKQSVPCCLNICPECLYQGIHFLPPFEITDRSPSRRISRCLGTIDQVSPESTRQTKSQHLRDTELICWMNCAKLRAQRSKFPRFSCTSCPFLFKDARSNALEARNTGCPLSLKLSTMTSAVVFRFPFRFVVVRSVPFFFVSWSEKRPMSNQKSFCVVLDRYRIRKTYIVISLIQSMSLNIDMKMIRSSSSSGHV